MRSHAPPEGASAPLRTHEAPSGSSASSEAPDVARADRLGHRLAPSSSAPIQAKITLERGAGQNGHELQHKNLADLNLLLGNSGAKVKHTEGKVEFESEPEADSKGSGHRGYRLVKRMIDHAHDVRIGHDPDSKGGPSSKVDSLDDARDAKSGSGSSISISKDHAGDEILADRGKGVLAKEMSPRHLVLGHELIHADRAQRGVQASGMSEYPVKGKYDGHDIDAKHLAKNEEAETVGLRAGGDAAAITENDLREDLGANRRALYESNVDEFLSTIAGVGKAGNKKQPRKKSF